VLERFRIVNFIDEITPQCIFPTVKDAVVNWKAGMPESLRSKTA
jgi:hypothetical protein